MTKKKTKQYPHDPKALIGYNILSNLDKFNRVGAAIQLHDRDISSLIDSEALKYYAQNADEDRWEDVKRQERESLVSRLGEYPMPSAMGTMNQLGTEMQYVGTAYNHIKNRDIPDMPNDYGMSDFLKDQWNSFLGEMNHLQAEDARGYKTRALNDKRLINAYNESLDALDEIEAIDAQLNDLSQTDRSDFTTKQLRNFNKQVNDLIDRKHALTLRYEELANDRKQLEDTVSLSVGGALVDAAMSGSGFLGGAMDWAFGKTTAVHDEINDARRFLYDIDNPRMSSSEKRRKLNRALKQYNQLDKDWQGIIDENEADQKKYQDKVSGWFKGREAKAGTDFFDPDTYLFKMPGIIGGSSSSYMKQIPAMAAGIVASIVSGGTASVPTAMAILGAGGGTSFYLQRGAGISENNAEVSLAAIEKIKERTGLSEQDIKDILDGKLTDQKKLRKVTENIRNSENLFEADMAATTWDAAIDAVLNTMPVGSIAKAGKYIRGTKAFLKAMENPIMRRAVESRIGQDFVSGWRTGEVMGPGAAAMTGITNATVGRLSKNLVVRAADSNIYGAMAHDMWRHMGQLSEAALEINPANVALRKSLINGTRNKYARTIGGRLIKSSVSEGIEEGKQYVNAEAFKSDGMDEKIKSTFDIALTDMLNGFSVGAHVIGIPLNSLGIVDIKDRQILQEIKGGMLGGFGHYATVTVLKDSLPYISELRANKIILEQVLNDKLAFSSKYDQYRKWVKGGLLQPSNSQVSAAFDRLRKANDEYKETYGQVGISNDLIDGAEKDYNRLIAIAKNPLTRKEAEAAGILVRTASNPTSWLSNDEYHKFVALKAIASETREDKRNTSNEKLNDLNKTINLVQSQMAVTNEGLEELLAQLQSLPEEETAEQNRAAENNRLRRLNRVQETPSLTELVTEVLQQEGRNDFDITHAIARLAALLKYRNYIETGLELQKNNPKVRRGLKEQLKSLNAEIDRWKKLNEDVVHSFGISVKSANEEKLSNYANAGQSINTLEDVEKHLVYNKEAHDQLRDAYEEYFKARDEYDSANRTYSELFGKPQRSENGKLRDITPEDLADENWHLQTDAVYTKGSAKKVIEDIELAQDDDDAFESAIEDVYKDDLKAEHLKDENGWNEENEQINPRQVRPVNDTNGNLIEVTFDEQGRINRELAQNEYIDNLGRVWEYVDSGRKDPLEEALKPRMTRELLDNVAKEAFAKVFQEVTGSPLPMSSEGLVDLYAKLVTTKENKPLSTETTPTPSSEDTKGPVVPPTPPTVPVAPIKEEKNPQEATLDMLDQKYEDDKKVVLKDPNGYHTTNQDYFILVDDKPTRMSRVHNVKPESYVHPDEEAEINRIYNDFNRAPSLSKIIELINKESAGLTNRSDVDVYIKYITDNENVFFVNTSTESINEYRSTIKNIARSIVSGRRTNSPSIRMGNVVDELARNFFGSNVLYSLTSTEQGINQLFDFVNESEQRTYRQLFTNEDSFRRLISDLRKSYDYYTNTLGWKLKALPFTWRAKFNNIGWVAGETDLIGIDDSGNIHIIDFKTSKHTFNETYTPNIKLTRDYSADLNIINESDFVNGKANKKVRNILRAIKNDTGVDNIVIRWNSDINGAVIVNKNRPFLQKPNAEYGQVISAYTDYSNQQTAYAQMISLETGGNVQSVEILPFLCSYDSQLRTIYSVNIQDRIPLTLSSNMQKILTGVVNRTDETINSARQELDTKYEQLLRFRDYIVSKFEISGEIFNTLSDNAKFELADYMSAIDNINIPGGRDLDAIMATIREVESLLDKYQPLMKSLRDDYTAELNKTSQGAEIRQKNEQVESKKQGEEPGLATGTIRARNKRDSMGNTSRTNLYWKQVEEDRDLELATSSPDFVTSADFDIYSDGDEIFVDITYGGKTWKRVKIDTTYNGTLFPNGRKLLQQVKELESLKRPGQRIVPVRETMTRTAGAIKLAKDDKGHYVYLPISETDLFANEDIYDIEFSDAYGLLGIIDNTGSARTFKGDASSRQTIFQWRNPKDVPAKGTLIYIKKVHKNETNQDSPIPVAIDRVKLTDDDVSFIINLLQNPELLDREYYTETNGSVYNLYATGRQLANLMIPIVDDQARLGEITSLFRDPTNPSLIRLMNRTDLASGQNGRGAFDISIPEQLLALINELKTMSIAESHNLLLARLGNNTTASLPFEGIRKFFAQNGAGLNAIRQLRISDAISFDIDDFKTVTSKKGVRREGLNGFGYYLKHGLLRTQYAGMGSCNVEIKDVTLEDKNGIDTQQTGAVQLPIGQLDTQAEESVDTSAIDAFLLKQLDKSTKVKPLSEEAARRHIKEILGDRVHVEFEQDFLKVISGAAHVVGACKADAIMLSSMAWNGVEYHEAYHRIFEMLIPEKLRDEITQKIANRIGVTLYNSDGSLNAEAFRACSEYAADRYMDHMNRHMTDIKIPFITKAWNKIHDWVATWVHYSDRELYKTFADVNSGLYVNAMPSKKQAARFNNMYKELYAQIHGINFEHIMNRPMYDKLKETVLFCIIQGQNVDRSGRNISEIGKHINKETFKAGIDKLYAQGYDIIGLKEGTIPTVGQLAMKELYDKFNMETLRDDIANAISILSTDYIKVREDESNDDAQGDSQDVANANIGEHTRSSYEFSRFEKTSSRVRFFFATIPDVVYGDPIEVVENGKKVLKKPVKLALNEFGLPQFVPINVLFNEVLNYFHDVDTVDELLSGLQYLGKEDPMFSTLYSAVNKIYKTTYTVKDERVVRNSDQEALISQLMNIIRSNKHSFNIARSKTVNGENGVYTIVIQPSDMEYNARLYPIQWNQMLVNGGTKIIKISPTGTLEFNKDFRGSQFAFDRMHDFFDHNARTEKAENGASYSDVGIKQWLSNITALNPQKVHLKLRVNGRTYYYNNPNDASQLEVVKDKIVEALNLVGININSDEFNYMLRHKYGSTDAQALNQMFSSTSVEDSMGSFIRFLKDVSTNGKINSELRVGGKKVRIQDAYTKMAFLKDLAKWKYQYRHAHDLLTVLATGNNKFYEISDNNYISDVVRFINKRSEEFEEIKQDPYNYFIDEEHKDAYGNVPVYGSLILEEITRNPDTTISLQNFIGFKSDKRDDTGSDYFEISEREDYVSKMSILEHGGIIMPTLSDKKTWVYIDGIHLPGLNYGNIVDNDGNVIAMENLGDQFIIPKDSISQFENMLSYNSDVISRFISYALSEYQSVLKADRDLERMEKDGSKSIEVDNYYTKEQGAKFSSLIGVWEYNYKKSANGDMLIVGETFHSFNDNTKSRKENIKQAEKYFFNRTREEQESLIARLLHKQLLREIDKCVQLGLIKKVGDSDNIFMNYENVGLNSQAIQSIYQSLIAKNGHPVDAITAQKYKSFATMLYISDISNKAIMSVQEVERVFSGNPAFYKWKYDKNGNLTDRTVDELKRLGGLISTGNNNFVEIKDIPEKYIGPDGKFTGKYVCAQVQNELIASPQSNLIDERMRYGELATAAYLSRESKEIQEFRDRIAEIAKIVNSERGGELSSESLAFYQENIDRMEEAEQEIRERISKEIDAMSEQQLEDSLDELTKSIALRKAKEASDSYHSDIDIADGGAYITDTMAEMLLRMNGNYSSVIENAFKILREETRSTILEKQSAYKAILTEVIGTQKYTAFGRRKHEKTGIQVAYYNKMALFPLFQCMSTGKMLNVFNKMKQQGIDMLMVDSAVKLGGQYSQGISWDDYMLTDDKKDPTNHIGNNIANPLKPAFDESFNFGTYELKFIYLRKQLNTDPREESMMTMGTQMTKIVMSNLFDGREYYFNDGTVMNGTELRNDIMQAINELSNRGLKSITTRFFKTNSKGELVDKNGEVLSDLTSSDKVLDEEKFSREVRQLLTTRDPDKNILDAIELIKQVDADGVTRSHMRLPLNAVSNSNWLESILISAINKKVIDIETPGAAFIQRSIWAMDGSTLYERGKGNILSDENLSPKINDGEKLLMVNEEGSMDCVVSIDFFKKMFKGEFPKVPVKDDKRNVVWDLVPQRDKLGNVKHDENGNVLYAQKLDENDNPVVDKNGKPVYKRKMRVRDMTFSEMRNWLINRGLIGKEAKAEIIGYRIPTQAESSIHALRIVDILPVVNDTIILPAEFTKITGSDKIYRCSNVKKFL